MIDLQWCFHVCTQHQSDDKNIGNRIRPCLLSDYSVSGTILSTFPGKSFSCLNNPPEW